MTSSVADPTSEDGLDTTVKHDPDRETVDTSHELKSPDSVQHTAPSDVDKADPHIVPLETPKGPEMGTHGPKLDKEGSSSFIKREKVSQDGYNWRKYGQKNVKGNEFIRSYYKCTQLNCNVKKQVERSLEGLVIDTFYFGRHDHPKPQSSIPVAVGFQVSIMEERLDRPSSVCAEEKSSDVPKQESEQLKPTDAPQPLAITPYEDGKNVSAQKSRLRDGADDDDPASKRKKKDGNVADSSSVDKLRGESRLVVQTSGDSETVNDGYRWRKYGQKLVKGNPNPRSYYRCSTSGCPAKKHVERASYDPKVVLTTYEGQHDHEMPPSRTVTHNAVRSNGHTAVQPDDTTTKPEGDTVCSNMLVKDNSCLGTNSKEQSDSNLDNVTSVSSAATNSVPDQQKESTDQDNTKIHCKSEEGDPIHGEAVVPQDNSVPCNELTKDAPSCQSSAKRDETSSIHVDTIGKSSEKHQQVRGATAVPS